MKTIRNLLWATTLTAASLSAFAQPQYERSLTVNERQARQEQRINAGVARGEISQREARELLAQQRDIRSAERRARADGRISRDEMRQLTAMLDDADMRIRHERRDFNRHRG